MEFEKAGKAGNPAVLLLTEGSPAEIFSALKGLEKEYRLLSAPADTSPAALEDALLRECCGILWGAYGLHAGADILLRLLAGGRVRARTAVLEGAFTLPDSPALPAGGRLICWMGGKDKAAKKSWQDLGEAVSPIDSLTIKKLPKKESLLSFRPDVAADRLKKAFGPGVSVQRTARMARSADRVWTYLCANPPEKELALLRHSEPPVLDEEQRLCLLEGRSDKLRIWVHATRVEALGRGRSVCTDRIDFDAGKLNAVARPLAELYLTLLQFRRERELKEN